MKTAEALTKSIAALKTKLAAAAAPEKAGEARGVRKQLKRAQRRLRQATGKKLATIRKKTGGEKAAAPAEGGEKK
jgi:hypothetical protein